MQLLYFYIVAISEMNQGLVAFKPKGMSYHNILEKGSIFL